MHNIRNPKPRHLMARLRPILMLISKLSIDSLIVLSSKENGFKIQRAHLSLSERREKVFIVPTLNPWRFIPEDILYHDNGRVLSLRKTQKKYFDALRGEIEDYSVARVCIIGDRRKICKNSNKILKIIKTN